MYSRGYSFQWDEGANGEHSWFVLTDAKNNEIIVANISTCSPSKRSQDDTCIIKPEDLKRQNNRIRSRSFVNYRKCKMINQDEIDDIIEDSSALNSRVPAWLVDKMAAGVESSKLTPMRIKNFYKEIKTPVKGKG